MLNTKYPGNLGHHEKTKPKNNRDRRSSAQRHRKYIQQNFEEYFLDLKDVTIKIQTAYRTLNRVDKKKVS